MKEEDNYKVVLLFFHSADTLTFRIISRPLKTIFQREVCKIEPHADFRDKPQKNSHGSFEIVSHPYTLYPPPGC